MSPLHNLRQLALAVAALVVLSVAGPTRADDSIPFSADLFLTFIGDDREAGLFAVEGSATHMGPVTGLVRNEVRGPRGPRWLGVIFLQNARGDTLSFSYELSPDTGEGTYSVTGGTGRFEGAGGGGALALHRQLPDGSFPVTLEGILRF